MSWDPNVPMVHQLTDYYYDISTKKEILELIKNAKSGLDKDERELDLYKPTYPNIVDKDITSDRIKKIEGIKSHIIWIEKVIKSLTSSFKTFENNMILEIGVINTLIVNLNNLCEAYLKEYQQALSTRTLNFKHLAHNSTFSSTETDTPKTHKMQEANKQNR